MKLGCLLYAVGLSVLCVVYPAYSQTPRPERPYLGLFGAGVGEWNQLLTASGSLGGVYDDNILAAARGGRGDPLFRQRGALGQLSGGLNYSLSRSRLSAGASAGTTVRYSPLFANSFVEARSGTAGASLRVLNRAAVTLNQSVAYRPFSVAGIFPAAVDLRAGEEAPPDLDVVLSRDHYLTYSGGVGFNQQVARHAFLSGDYVYRVRNASSHASRFTTQGARTVFRLGLSRDLGLRLGYGYQQARYSPGDPRIWYHDVDVGLDFSKALALTRNTAFSFGTGSSASVRGGQTRIRATGNARLNHEIGRSWDASLAYRRGMLFIETLQQPVFGDSATFQLSGLLNRRVRFQSSARALLGDAGVSGRNRFDSYHGVVGLMIALNRYLAAGLDYSLYHYRFEDDIVLPLGVSRDIDRQSLRAHLNLWTLLFQQRGRPDATR
jgi:hypothetical protein